MAFDSKKKTRFLVKEYFRRLLSKPTEASALLDELEQYRVTISNLQKDIKSLLTWKDQYSTTLGVLTESMQTLVWSKDEFGYYTIANARHCELFFGFTDPTECVRHIVGKTEKELLEEAKKTRGVSSSLSSVCSISDDYAKNTKKVSHFLEAGVVNNEEVLLYVIKIPRLNDKGDFIGLVGIAWDISFTSEYMITQLNRWIYDKKALKLFQCNKVFCYVIEPSMRRCSIFQHICPPKYKSDCMNEEECKGGCNVSNRMEES